MGKSVRAQIRQAKRAFAERNVEMARDLVRQDDVVDNLNKECFQLAIEIGDEHDRREWAMTMMLVARALERIGDNAVDVGEQVAFVVTGLFREFEDASHPGEEVAAPQTVVVESSSRCPARDLGPHPSRLTRSAAMLCAAIDIGSNTTRVLVAEPQKGQLRKVMEQRAYTRIGKASQHDGAIDAEKVAEVAEVVATQVRLAEELGAEAIRTVATAAIREAANRERGGGRDRSRRRGRRSRC